MSPICRNTLDDAATPREAISKSSALRSSDQSEDNEAAVFLFVGALQAKGSTSAEPHLLPHATSHFHALTSLQRDFSFGIHDESAVESMPAAFGDNNDDQITIARDPSQIRNHVRTQ
jgi:hypothetical protein